MARIKRVKSSPKNGFTIIEVILGVFILGVVIIALIEVFLLAQNQALLNRRKDFASAYAQSLVENSRSTPFGSLANGTFSGSASSSSIPVTVNATRVIEDTSITGLKQIRVQYSFSHNGKTYTDYLVSYATDNGLND